MKRLDLLKQMSFGVQVAEEEVNELASYFVGTNQWGIWKERHLFPSDD